MQYLRFNSITVQLRPGLVRRDDQGGDLFQFHNGTIKTVEGTQIKFLEERFNSITVQLRHYDGAVEGEKKNRFNSITVQLRPIKYSKKTSNNKQVIQ